MPYINREDRHKYQDLLSKISKLVIKKVDENVSLLPIHNAHVSSSKRNLQYSYMYHILTDLIEIVWGPIEKRRYSDHQNVSGYLYCACLEYDRRYVKVNINSKELPDLWLLSLSEFENYIMELGNLVPKDHMAISGNMNYITSYLLDEVWGPLENRTQEDHLFIEYLLENKANTYYKLFTAPYEDKKIAEQGDLRDL